MVYYFDPNIKNGTLILVVGTLPSAVLTSKKAPLILPLAEP
jgi:hypothetical protein